MYLTCIRIVHVHAVINYVYLYMYMCQVNLMPHKCCYHTCAHMCRYNTPTLAWDWDHVCAVLVYPFAADVLRYLGFAEFMH